MNNIWIVRSKASTTVSFKIRAGHLNDHEYWLDCLNLHETSWILFADNGSHRTEPFGWPKK